MRRKGGAGPTLTVVSGEDEREQVKQAPSSVARASGNTLTLHLGRFDDGREIEYEQIVMLISLRFLSTLKEIIADSLEHCAPYSVDFWPDYPANQGTITITARATHKKIMESIALKCRKYK